MTNDKKLLDRITVDPRIMAGKPIIRGQRISVEQILLALGGGVSEQELLAEYPELEIEDIYAALLYAGELVKEERVFTVGIQK